MVTAIRPLPDPDPALQPAFLTLPEAAKILRISVASLRRELDRGGLRSVKIGRRRLIVRLSIEALQAESA